MKKEDLENLTQKLEKRVQTKEKRKERQMRVSGRSVFRLQKIIRGKAKKS